MKNKGEESLNNFRKKLSPLQAIKRYCRINCCANDLKSWKFCSVENCPLWCYRMGKRFSDKKDAVLRSRFVKKEVSVATNSSETLNSFFKNEGEKNDE